MQGLTNINKEITAVDFEKCDTSSLLGVLRSLRAQYRSIMDHAGPRCCEECREFIGDKEDWQKVPDKARPFKIRIAQVKKDIK